MNKCPNCGVSLKFTVEADTDYSKTDAIINAKASGADLTNEQLNSLKWKQSVKRESLSTIPVTEAVLGVPIAKLLYERLKNSANKSWRVDRVSYKLSSFEGQEFLQRWQPVATAGGSI